MKGEGEEIDFGTTMAAELGSSVGSSWATDGVQLRGVVVVGELEI